MNSEQREQAKGEEKSVPEILTYQYFQENRYKISEFGSVESLCNNGFIKLYTLKTRVYWHAQNQFGHRVPDWKFHVSVNCEDLKKAWNILVGLFLKMKCRAGMKVIYLKESENSQRGRQITVYIVKVFKQLEKSLIAQGFDLSIAEEHSQDYWRQFVQAIENLLKANHIRSNGLAAGDLKIGEYVSLRNEAFVESESGNFIYPPNDVGWNPLGQQIPFNLSKFGVNKKAITAFYYYAVPLLAFSLGLFCRRSLMIDY